MMLHASFVNLKMSDTAFFRVSHAHTSWKSNHIAQVCSIVCTAKPMVDGDLKSEGNFTHRKCPLKWCNQISKEPKSHGHGFGSNVCQTTFNEYIKYMYALPIRHDLE